MDRGPGRGAQQAEVLDEPGDDPAGIADADRIIERRAGTRQLRIGGAQLEVVPLASGSAAG